MMINHDLLINTLFLNMGCSYGKTTAIAELNSLIKQISGENSLLEKERDKLRSQHDDKVEEEKGSLHDLNQMHKDLEKELKELKQIMLDFMPMDESDEIASFCLKKGVERISKFQDELEQTSMKIKEMITKRDEIKKEHSTFEDLIIETENRIGELENAIANQEETLKDQENFEEKLQMYERQKSDLLEELKEAEKIYKELSNETTHWVVDETMPEKEKNTIESLLSLSESDVNRELKVVEKQLQAYNTEIKELEMKELELQHMDEYIINLQSKLSTNSKNEYLKQQIIQSEERIELLKIEKKRVKNEVCRKKKSSGVIVDDKNSKYGLVNSKDQDQMEKILNELEPLRKSLRTSNTINY